MGEGGASVKEVGFLEFQQWVSGKIPAEEDEDGYYKPLSDNKNTIRWRRWKEKKFHTKKDYGDYLKDMRERARERNKK